jgi:nucleoside-diphosphate-sugar epimerase/carbamoylphosphate synthase large subunit
MSKQIGIAVTSVGSGIGQSIVQSCRLSHLPLFIVGFDLNPFAFGAYDCDSQQTVPKVTSPEYIDKLLSSCVEFGVSLLIPGLDSELLLISKNKKRFEDKGIRVLVADPPFIQLCRDKILWSCELHSKTNAIIPCYDYNKIESLIKAGEVKYPLIAKPKDGSASAGVRIINSERSLHKLNDSFVIQPYIFPADNDPYYETLKNAVENEIFLQIAEVSVQYAISRDKQILGKMASYNRLKDGVPIEIVPVEDQRIWDTLEDLFPYLYEKGMYGPVNFQGRMTEKGPIFFEMNGRFTGITGLRSMMGFNEVEVLIKHILEINGNGVRHRIENNPRRIGIRQVSDRTVNSSNYRYLSEKLKSYNLNTGHTKKEALLITGATGWLGKQIVNALFERDIYETIILLVRNNRGSEFNNRLFDTRRIRIVQTSEYLNGTWSIGRIDTILHLASGRSPDGAEAIADGLKFTEQLVTDAALFQIPAFINISSQSVYGLKQKPLWSESLPLAPETPYAMAKTASEYMVESLRRHNRPTHTTSLRLSRLYGYGEGMRWSELPHQFAHRAVKGEKLIIQGGNQRFDLIHIDDAVEAIIQVLGSDPQTWRTVYNLGCGTSIGIVEIAEHAIESAKNAGCSGASVEIVPDSNSMEFGMTMDLFQQDFNWVPRVSIKEAMDKLVSVISNGNKALEGLI